MRNRVGEIVSITKSAIYVKGFPQDLLGGKSLNKETVRVILDGDPHISGLYPLDGKQEPQFKDSIPFFSEPTDLFYLQTEKMGWTQFERMTGYDLLHWRLGHMPNRFIKLTIIQLEWRSSLEESTASIRNVHHV